MSRSERVRALVDGELDEASRDALRADAEDDPELAALLEEARVVAVALDALEPQGPPPVPDDLVNGAMRRALSRRAEEAEAPGWRRALRALSEPGLLRLRVRPLVALVAMTSLVLFGVGLGHRAGHDRSGAVSTSASNARSTSAASPGSANRSTDATNAGSTQDARSEPSATETVQRVVVRLMLPMEGAQRVSVAGDFNAWQTDADVLEDPEGDGVFVGSLRLSPGTYGYMFVVDGERWVSDPYALNHRDDGFGNRNAVLRID